MIKKFKANTYSDKIIESISFFDSNDAQKKLKEVALEYDYKKIVKKTLY